MREAAAAIHSLPATATATAAAAIDGGLDGVVESGGKRKSVQGGPCPGLRLWNWCWRGRVVHVPALIHHSSLRGLVLVLVLVLLLLLLLWGHVGCKVLRRRRHPRVGCKCDCRGCDGLAQRLQLPGVN